MEDTAARTELLKRALHHKADGQLRHRRLPDALAFCDDIPQATKDQMPDGTGDSL